MSNILTFIIYKYNIRSLWFMLVTLFVAEVCGKFNPLLQPRNVASVITLAVVISGLLIIFSDWGFSQVLLRYAENSSVPSIPETIQVRPIATLLDLFITVYF